MRTDRIIDMEVLAVQRDDGLTIYSDSNPSDEWISSDHTVEVRQ